MFNLGGGEILVILLLALIVLGPQKLPEAARKVGNVVGELRRMSSSFQSELRDAMNEPVNEMRNTLKEAEIPPTPAPTAKPKDVTEPAPAETAPPEVTPAEDAPTEPAPPSASNNGEADAQAS